MCHCPALLVPVFCKFLCHFVFLVGFLFPTCQVRVVRFYQSACPPPPPPPRLAVLLVLLLASSSSFSSTMSASTSTCTSALPTLRQALCRLSSPSSLPTSQLSVHRWTSTWDLPSSVCTAGPQQPDRMPEDMVGITRSKVIGFFHDFIARGKGFDEAQVLKPGRITTDLQKDNKRSSCVSPKNHEWFFRQIWVAGTALFNHVDCF